MQLEGDFEPEGRFSLVVDADVVEHAVLLREDKAVGRHFARRLQGSSDHAFSIQVECLHASSRDRRILDINLHPPLGIVGAVDAHVSVRSFRNGKFGGLGPDAADGSWGHFKQEDFGIVQLTKRVGWWERKLTDCENNIYRTKI